MAFALKSQALRVNDSSCTPPLRIPKWILLLLAIFGATVSSKAEKFAIQAASVNWRGGQGNDYGIFDTVTHAYAVNITVSRKKTDKEDVPFFVTFSINSSGNLPRNLSSGANILHYQIYDSLSQNNVLSDLPTASINEVLSGVFSPDEMEKRFTYFVVIPALQIQPPGTYQDSVTLTVHEGTLNSYKSDRSTVITIATQVARLVELSIVNRGQPFVPESVTKELNFGGLEEGKSLGFDLRMRSNAGYTVTIESENNGFLKHTSLNDNSSIPYTFTLGGMLLDLSRGPITPISKNVITTAEGDPYEGLVTVGTTKGASAGNYRDTITLTVQTTN